MTMYGQTRMAGLAAFALATSCSPRAAPLAPRPGDEVAAILLIDNTTTHNVSVYFVDRTTHVRLGSVEPRSEGRVPVRKTVLQNRNVFRVYAFRGQDACPVARLVDIATSRTPRITVTATDTVLSAYLPGDGCRKTGKSP